MKSFRSALLAGAVAASLAPGIATAAEEGEVKMMSPWESAGQVFRTGEDQVLFLGVAEGIVYIEDGISFLASLVLTELNRLRFEWHCRSLQDRADRREPVRLGANC